MKMKKGILFLSLLAIIGLLAVNFTTYKTVESKQLPVSSISSASEGFVGRTMKIYNDNKLLKVKMENEFFLVNDPNIGIPNGSFTLSTKKNVFGFTKHEAHNVVNEGV